MKGRNKTKKDLRGEQARNRDTKNRQSNAQVAAQMHQSVSSHTYQNQAVRSVGLL